MSQRGPLMALAIASLAMLLLASRHWGRARHARRTALFLSRLGSDEAGGGAESSILGHQRSRLAKHTWLQNLFHDIPGTGELSGLLEQSGLDITVARVLAVMGAAAAAAFVAALLIGLVPLGCLLLAAAAAGAPLLWVMQARSRRARAFELQLPQALELIGLYLRSGRSLPQAFLGATEEIGSPAAEEFLTVAEEYRLGRPLDVALKRLAIKYPESLGFRLFSIAVGVLGKTGGNLVEVLERIKKTLDAGIKYGLRLKAMTGESRMSAWILGVLPGGFLGIAALFNPSYFKAFYDSTIGVALLAVFFALWMGGVAWIRALMQTRI